MPEAPVPPKPGPAPKDPVIGRSLSFALLISCVLLILTLMWALYDEDYTMRPWKQYQTEFVRLYRNYLEKAIPEQAKVQQKVESDPQYIKLTQEADAAQKAVASQVADIDNEISSTLNPQITILNKAFANKRGEIGALTYQYETATSESDKQSLQKKIDAATAETVRVVMPATPGHPEAAQDFTFDQLNDKLNELKARKTYLQTHRVEVTQPATDLHNQRDIFVKEHLVGLTEDQMKGVLTGLDQFQVEIKQIHVADIDLVDRCESCHLGTRESLVLTAADMGGQEVYISHPKPELLQIHDPTKFGCSPCHNGNGRATTSVELAHGTNEYWMYPLYAKENIEAGCQQCHTNDRYLPLATTLNEGKFLFDHRGCVGCHRYEGYDSEPEDLKTVQQELQQEEEQKRTDLIAADRAVKQGDNAPDNATAQRLYAQANDLRVTSSGLDAQIEQLNLRAADLLRERKKVGPDLKEVRAKLNKNWIPVWLDNPQDFRPGTRMPHFRFGPGELQAVAAFIWQSGIQAQIPSQPPGDAVNGKELFETRGCMACHSVGEGASQVGGTFAANLSREGEKVNYDYLVRWIHNPRDRVAPYSPSENRDLTPADYAKHGLPYVFDVDHAIDPNDGQPLQVQQMTIMPSLRLSWEDSRDIASYLMTLKKKEPSDYPPAPYLDDPSLKAKGLDLVKHYGCAGCHEIAGLEDETRIGTELTKEGSKPIERLDFALLTLPAETQGWYTLKGFFEHKLANPAVYDQGMVKEQTDKLRMPNFNLSKEEINALTTFLLGSVDSALPPRYFYAPQDQRRDIQEGWKIVEKYNCTGCHQLRIGQRSVLMDLPRYQSPDWKDQLPPILIGEGARVTPDFLATFLNNPALSDTDLSRDGIRPYLKARMPTFFFSPDEIGKLIRFFEALSSQPDPYIATKLEPLTDQERTLARALFSSAGAPCLQCHATGDPVHDQRASAPNFLLAKDRLKPDWAKRWMLDPSAMAPGTAMPSGLFRQENGRWVFAGPTPPGFAQYTGDQADLLVRYIFAFTPEEQRRLPATPTPVASVQQH